MPLPWSNVLEEQLSNLVEDEDVRDAEVEP
jgi:hypothetical protein